MADYSSARREYDSIVAKEAHDKLRAAKAFTSDSYQEQLMSPKDRQKIFGDGHQDYFVGKLSWAPIVEGSVVLTYPISHAKHARWRTVTEGDGIMTIDHGTGRIELRFGQWKGPAKGVPLMMKYRYKTGTK